MPKVFHYFSSRYLKTVCYCISYHVNQFLLGWRNHQVLSEYGFDRVVLLLFHDAFTPSFELPILVISISYF